MHPLVRITQKLSHDVGKLSFPEPVTHVYNPLLYAKKPHEIYLKRYGSTEKKAVFLGMNPGPFGMAQTGIPFGDVKMVKQFLKIEAPVQSPTDVHPKRPILGFECKKSETSGTRLWGFFQNRFNSADHFFSEYFVINYCPLVFMGASGVNLTPDKLPKQSQASLFDVCDQALADMLRVLKPQFLIGVGGFAKKCADRIQIHHSLLFNTLEILHPSPASPRANKGWAKEVLLDLKKQKFDL